MLRLFAELEPSITVTGYNLADRVLYILRSNIFDVAELERLRREAVPSSNENTTAEDAAPQVVEQPANVDTAVNTLVVIDSNDDRTVAQELELERMRSTLEEAIVESITLSKRNRAVVRALSPMLVTYLEVSRDLCETDSFLFGAALAVCRIIGAKVSTAGRATGQSSAIAAWRIRIEERIAKALIGRPICFRSGNNRPIIVRTVRMAFAGTNVSLDITQKLTERIEDLKQRIAAWGKWIRQYTERSTRFNQNRLFQSDQKRLYESLERPMSDDLVAKVKKKLFEDDEISENDNIEDTPNKNIVKINKKLFERQRETKKIPVFLSENDCLLIPLNMPGDEMLIPSGELPK
ncbi:unnamed protein product [Parnassius apollo]|uniref:(apollo) hypothetical protein n=1 Tax=Parnassius apollo TaxID=110799 RepID=A0A8S3W4I2_PARAO|nr:unnamed protein product [Parnassius apollo]